MSSRSRHPATLAVLAVAGLLTLAGCATHTDSSSSSSDAGPFPVTVTPPGGKAFTMKSRPKHIVSLSAADTETLFAIGAGKQVVAVDKQSNYPPEAPHTNLDAIHPSTEAIAKYEPDLVVASNDMGGLVANMHKVGIPVLIMPAPEKLDAAYREWSQLGKVTGHAGKARQVVGDAKKKIAKAVSDTPKPESGEPLSYYHELDPSLYTATSHTFIGSVYDKFGLHNIADPADSASAAGYPQLSPEQVVKADPELIFLADTRCCSANAKTVADRPGWGALTAVKNGDVVGLNDDIASRWGPRIVDFVRSVSDAVTKAVTKTGSHTG